MNLLCKFWPYSYQYVWPDTKTTTTTTRRVSFTLWVVKICFFFNYEDSGKNNHKQIENDFSVVPKHKVSTILLFAKQKVVNSNYPLFYYKRKLCCFCSFSLYFSSYQFFLKLFYFIFIRFNKFSLLVFVTQVL